ncbi:hypothetical protein J0H58_32740 [bacterium]|nr:hypothetical protein [bacterium]
MTPITDTFVLVADDCPETRGEVPPGRGDGPTVPAIQHELLAARPYQLTLEDLIFETHVRRLGLTAAQVRSRGAAVRAELFAKPHPCLRASPLTKRYGWGAHHDASGRIALYGMETADYRRLAAAGPGLTVVKAMRTRRA